MRPSPRKPDLRPVREEISDLLDSASEDRFSSATDARKKAMDFLARREYGQQELVRKLISKGFVDDVAEQAVARLADEGLQSDQRFAANFIQSRVNQGKGPVRIRIDLGQRGIVDAAIDSALQKTTVDWFVLARAVRVKKFGRSHPADFKAKAKQMRFLQYRGFDQDQIKAAVGDDD